MNILNCKVWIDRKKHDEILSITSHLPHLISSALVGIAKKDYEIDEIIQFKLVDSMEQQG